MSTEHTAAAAAPGAATTGHILTDNNAKKLKTHAKTILYNFI